MTDLGHGKLLKVTKDFDRLSPLKYDGAPSLTLDDELATKGYVDNAAGGSADQEVLPVTTPGQTAFTLSQTPSGTDAFGLFLNGQLRLNPTDYSFSGTALTWNNAGITLQTTDQLIAWYNFSSPAIPIFDKQNIYYVNKAGNDTNGGKSDDDPLLTIGQAITLINALTGGDIPSQTNRYVIKIIGGGQYTEDFTLPNWVTLDAPAIVLKSNVIGKNGGTIIVNDWFKPTTGDRINLQITSPTNGFNVFVKNFFQCADNGGIKHTSTGPVYFSATQILCDAPLLPAGNTGNMYINFDEIFSAGPSVIVYNNLGNLYMKGNRIRHTNFGAPTSVFSLQGACFIKIIANDLYSENDKIYSVQSGPVLDFECNTLKEGSASIVSGANVNSRITRNDNDKLLLRNDTFGLLLKSEGGGNTIDFEVEGGSPLTVRPNSVDLPVANKLGLGDSHLMGNFQLFSNLGTTPVALNFEITRYTIYMISLRSPGNHTNTFLLSVDYNSNVPELVLNEFIENNGAVTQGPAGTFNILINGYATASFNLVVTTTGVGIGDATLAASTATTGSTRLYCIRLSNYLT